MKNTLLLLFAICCAASAAGREPRFESAATAHEPHFSYAATAGTAFSLSLPSSTPFTAQLAAYYNPWNRFSIGAGVGVSCYEKVLLPLFGEVQVLLTRPRKFTPYLACAAGYAFATASDANGGAYLNPAIGVRYALRNGMKLLFAVGYEQQPLERLKTYRGGSFEAAFSEQLRHSSISVRIGVLF